MILTPLAGEKKEPFSHAAAPQASGRNPHKEIITSHPFTFVERSEME
jgi:hypothetical protein